MLWFVLWFRLWACKWLPMCSSVILVATYSTPQCHSPKTMILSANTVKTSDLTYFYSCCRLLLYGNLLLRPVCILISETTVGSQLTFVILACGYVKFQERVSRPFQQNFIITAQGDKWKIVSDCFRLQEPVTYVHNTAVWLWSSKPVASHAHCA